MEILLVRHTTPSVEKGICYGQTDLALADTFEIERAQVLVKIKEMGLNTEGYALYSSPLKRCADLADFLSQNLSQSSNQSLNQRVIYDDRLKELNFGAWENQAWNDLPQDDLMLWMNDFVQARPPEGESFEDLNTRVFNFIKSLQIVDSQLVVLVTHAGVMRVLMAQAQGLPLAKAFEIKLDYGAVALLKADSLISP